MLNYVIVVNDGGELKSITAQHLEDWSRDNGSELAATVDAAVNSILDTLAIEAGEYDPSDNDTPFEVVMEGQSNG